MEPYRMQNLGYSVAVDPTLGACKSQQASESSPCGPPVCISSPFPQQFSLLGSYSSLHLFFQTPVCLLSTWALDNMQILTQQVWGGT